MQNEIFPLLPSKTDIKYINEIDKEFLIEFNKTDLKKVVLNLLNNGIKYTDKGYIKIYNENYIVVFENSGKKIDEEFKEKIFEPFFTISQSKNRKASGFGLGLSIVKNLCQNNGYTCTLHSSDIMRTRFYLRKINKEMMK
jgi:signal transduction histidine kinase